MSSFANATSSLSTAAQTLPSLDHTTGALLVGNYLSLILFGLALAQAHQYYVSYPGDRAWIKYYVALVMIGETICTVCCMHISYFVTTSNFANRAQLNYVPWSSSVFTFVGSTTVIISQSFFMHRVWRLGRQYRILVFIAGMLLLVELSVCYVTGADEIGLEHWDKAFKKLWLISIHNAVAAVADLITAGVLIYTLHQGRTGVERTDRMINVLIAYAVSTGLITGVYNIVSFIFTIHTTNFIFFAISMVGIKLYSNSLLAALNSRQSISRRHMVGYTDTSPFGVSIRKNSVSFCALPPQVSREESSRTDTNEGHDTIVLKTVKGFKSTSTSDTITVSVRMG